MACFFSLLQYWALLVQYATAKLFCSLYPLHYSSNSLHFAVPENTHNPQWKINGNAEENYKAKLENPDNLGVRYGYFLEQHIFGLKTNKLD